MFEELRRLSPDHYQLSHLRTLQRGVRKIRVRLAEVDMPLENAQNPEVFVSQGSEEHKQPQESIQDAEVSALMGGEEEKHNADANEQLVSAITGSLVVPAHGQSFSSSFDSAEEPASVQEPSSGSGAENISLANEEPVLDAFLVSDPSSKPSTRCKHSMSITIEEAIGDYLGAQQRAKRRPKTMKWHQTALELLGRYLRTECQCVLLVEMTERHVQGWLESLHMPTLSGVGRSAGTRHSYARSVRAWCQWLVNAGLLTRTPFASLSLPKVEPPVMHPLETEEWERLLLACESPGEHGVIPEWAPARNHALLWVLHDTGMRLSEVCALRLGDIDLEQGMLMVRRNNFKGRRLPLGYDALHAVRVYVEQHRVSGRKASLGQGGVREKPLFLSETGYGLTENGIVSVFGRLKRRAGVIREEIGPTLVRDSFAVRYLQAGGDVFTLRDLLGQQESATVKRFLQMNNWRGKNNTYKKCGGSS